MRERLEGIWDCLVIACVAVIVTFWCIPMALFGSKKLQRFDQMLCESMDD